MWAVSNCGKQGLGVGFSLQWLLLLWSIQASAVAAHELSSCDRRALEHRVNSCGTHAYLLYGLWDLPGPGIKPMSSALAGRFFTTEPQGNPCYFCS